MAVAVHFRKTENSKLFHSGENQLDAKEKKIGISGRKPVPWKGWGKNLFVEARSIWAVVMSNNCS